MTDVQIFQLAGILLTVIGLAWVIKPKLLAETIQDFAESRGVFLLTGLLTMIAGYLLIVFHNVWNSDITVIITILGWVAFLKGLFIVIVPATTLNLYGTLSKTKYFTVMPWLVLIVGIVGLYLGFLA